MKRRRSTTFDVVIEVGLALPHVEVVTRYDGFPALKVAGVFMAGLATHPSAEPNTLVVRAGIDERETFIEDAPETYYLTDFYRPYPLVLVRLEHVTRDALRELLSSSHRLTMPKTRLRKRRGTSGSPAAAKASPAMSSSTPGHAARRRRGA